MAAVKKTFGGIVRRELEVAFARHVQPLWLRVTKYLVLAAIIYVLWGTGYLGFVLALLFAAGLTLHFWYRYKTKGWTQSYGGWNYELNKPKHEV